MTPHKSYIESRALKLVFRLLYCISGLEILYIALMKCKFVDHGRIDHDIGFEWTVRLTYLEDSILVTEIKYDDQSNHQCLKFLWNPIF